MDEQEARAWLGRIVTAYPGEAEGVSEEAPPISPAWRTGADGAEWTAEALVSSAIEDGIITCPAGMDVCFTYKFNSDGGSYHFTVDIGYDVVTQVSLDTWGYEMRKLGDPGATGIEAALSVLEEAVSFSNKTLDNLVLLAAQFARQQADPASQAPGTGTGPSPSPVTFELTYWASTRYQVTLAAADVEEKLRAAGMTEAADTAGRIACGEITAADAGDDEEDQDVGFLAATLSRTATLFAVDAPSGEPDDWDTPERYHVWVAPEPAEEGTAA